MRTSREGAKTPRELASFVFSLHQGIARRLHSARAEGISQASRILQT